MENTCLYCKNPFSFRRATRKYCSNTCRQLDYYKRKKEFTVAGYFSVKQEEDSVKDFTVKPLSVKEKVELNALSDQQLDLLAEKVIALLEDRIQDIVYRKTFSVNDPVSVKNSVKDTVKEQELFVDEVGISVKEPDTVKESEQKREYKLIQSRFIDHIVKHLDRNNSDALSKFLYPHLYWTAEYTAKVKWVSLRFRCLLECLIDFSRFRFIDGEDLQQVAEAFSTLENSRHFKALKEDYPHKELIYDLSEKTNYRANENREIVRFFISPEKKAKLIATRFEIGNFVPKIYLSELDFSE